MTRYQLRAGQRSRGRLDLDALNEEQRAVVLHGGGPALVIAGAGSGKTRTLTYRAAQLIERGLDPRRMLLCTFTNRAAREMVRRVEELLGLEVRRLWAGTFHHVANLALRRHATTIGLPENYTILDREDAKDLIGACLAEEGRALLARRFPSPQVLQQLASSAINRQLPLLEVIRVEAPRFYDLSDELARVIDRYATRKLRLGLVDYDDLLLMFKILLTEQAEIAAQLCSGFEHVLVDEYQDTNRLQGDIVDICASAHGNLMVVGDDAQSIYAFRGAYFKNIIDFPRRYPEATVYRLERNYRSTPEILGLANASIANNRHQHPKTLRAVRPPGMQPALVQLHDVYQQAGFVAQRVLELHHEQQLALSQCAVLYRAHAHSLELQVELTRRKIPYVVRSGLRFFEQAHIKDVTCYLRLVHNGGDALAWQRILRLWSGVGRRTSERVIEALGERSTEAPGETLTSPELIARLPGGARPAIRQLAALLARLERDAAPAELLRRVLEEHYRHYAQSAFANAATRIEDLEQLALFAARYDSLEGFLSELALVAGFAAEATGPGDPPDDKLTLSTIHQAKGLEWRAVFVLGLCEGRFPQAIAARTPTELEEERRLFYVATTRAMDQLYLCHPRIDESSDSLRRLLRLSRFVGELEGRPSPYERWEIEETDEPVLTAEEMPS